MKLLGCCIALLGFTAAAGTTNIVTEIQDGLKTFNEGQHNYFSKYLGMSDLEIIAALPLKKQDGSQTGYTLFVPTNSAIRRLIPQDIGDPYFDPDLRLSVLMRHLARQRLSPEDLAKLTSLTMADGKTFKITNDKGEIMLNNAKVVPTSLLSLPTVNVYVIEQVFVEMEEISAAIARHPYEVSFFGPRPAKPYDELIPLFPTGGYNRRPVTDDDIKDSAAAAVTELSKTKTGDNLKLVAIKAAESQTFYGGLTKLTLEVETQKKELLTCQVVIFERYWIKETKLNSHSCAPKGAAAATPTSSKSDKKQ